MCEEKWNVIIKEECCNERKETEYHDGKGETEHHNGKEEVKCYDGGGEEKECYFFKFACLTFAIWDAKKHK